MTNVGHLIVIRTNVESSVIIARTEARATRAIRIREARGEIIEKIGCAAQCPCDGRYEAGDVDFHGNPR